MTIFWLIVSFIFLFIELGNPGLFFFLSFACAAFVSFIVSLFFCSLFLQISVFLMSFLFFIFFLKIIVLPAINSTIYRSNTAALLGKTGVVIKDITEYQIGQIVVNGQVWSAHSSNKNLISIGTSVLVESIIGCHLVVREKVNFIER